MANELTPGTEPVVIDGDVHFWLTVNGKPQRYAVSREALEDHFPPGEGDGNGLLEAFARGRDRICDVAQRKIGAGAALSGSNTILVGTHDL
ncbi:DUF1488 domain-containing protein [Ralstonia wenshanensis]|uniref:DUF1488 domain-containing protein n=1 Tax=Ralstonia wenshanensis TaxID=2842456 RepID=UPI0039C67E6C